MNFGRETSHKRKALSGERGKEGVREREEGEGKTIHCLMIISAMSYWT